MASCVLFLSPSMVVSLLAQGLRTHFDLFNPDKTYFEVTDVIENGKTTAAFFLCLAGLMLVLLGIVTLFLLFIFSETFNGFWIASPVAYCSLPLFSLGLSLVPSAALRASEVTVPSYLLITITTLAPLFSFFVTIAKSSAVYHS